MRAHTNIVSLLSQSTITAICFKANGHLRTYTNFIVLTRKHTHSHSQSRGRWCYMCTQIHPKTRSNIRTHTDTPLHLKLTISIRQGTTPTGPTTLAGSLSAASMSHKRRGSAPMNGSGKWSCTYLDMMNMVVYIFRHGDVHI